REVAGGLRQLARGTPPLAKADRVPGHRALPPERLTLVVEPQLLHPALRRKVLAVRNADDLLQPSLLEAEAQRGGAPLGPQAATPVRTIQGPPHLGVVGGLGPVVVVQQPDPPDELAAGAILDSPDPEAVLFPLACE